MGSTSPLLNKAGQPFDQPLPNTVADLTPEWFTKIVGHKVKTANVVKEIHGTASKILVELGYENAPVEAAPKRVCVKGGFNPELLKVHPALAGVYQLEAQFFEYVAPDTSGMRLPKSWFNGIDTAGGQGLIVLDDLTAMGWTFGEPTEAWPVTRVRSALEQLAILHGRTWGKRSADYPQVSTAIDLRDVVASLISEQAWKVQFDREDRPPLPAYLLDRKRVFTALKTLWRTPDERFAAVLHGDGHVGNTFIKPDGQPGFLDWQGVHFGSVFHDVCYFMTGALTPEDRRQHEEELLMHYLEHLHKNGGAKFTKDEVWLEFRRQQMYGFVWSLTPYALQAKERVDAMTVRYCSAIADHKTLELLESLPEHQKLEE